MLTLCTAAVPSCAAPLEKPEVNIAIGGTQAHLYFLPVLLADRLGYFSQEGLNVHMIDTGAGAKGLQALVGGSVDVTAGSFGHVFRAVDAELGRTVAIKILSESLSSDRDRLERFQQEGRVLSSLKYPNLVAIYNVASQVGVPFLLSNP